MLKFLSYLALVISISHGLRLHRRQADASQAEPGVLAARSPPRPAPVLKAAPAQSQTLLQPQEPNQPQQFQPPVQPQSLAQSPLPAAQQALLPQQQPFSAPEQNIQPQTPFSLQSAELGPALLQGPQQPRLSQDEWRRFFAPPRQFAPGFEAKPIPVDLSLNQPKVQWIGADQQGQNLAVIRPQEQKSSKGNEQLLSSRQLPEDQPELKQRIFQQAQRTLVNTAGRDREALLARINVTGNPDAAAEFVRALKNLSDFQEKEPFASADVMKGLINSEIQLAVDNWIMNEEVAGELAATFNIPRDSSSASFVLTPADIDDMKFAGNNPTAAKTFHVHLQELLWKKVDQQYRVTTDLMATLSDAFLGLLVGNGLVKEKFAEDIATHFYRANNRRIKLF